MNKDATSLDRLHDIATPPAVPWWPLAPGWYVVFAIVAALFIVLARRWWKNWKANAYRRAALRELAAIDDATGIAALLRRTALAIAPREVIAEKSGSAWLDWLASQSSGGMSDETREQLTGGVYARTTDQRDLTKLRDYATRWISDHQESSVKEQEVS